MSLSISPAVTLDDESIEGFGRELDAIQNEIKASLGDHDRRYIKRVIAIQRSLAVAGRLAIYASLPLLPTGLPFLAVIGAGTVTLGIAKILENMEIGHNVIHGQWDWMNDPEIHSSTWEWDMAGTSEHWKHSHNFIHHTYTNSVGKDRDVGYGLLRVTRDYRWQPKNLAQPAIYALLALLFEYGIAFHDIDVSSVKKGKKTKAQAKEQLRAVGRKIRR